MPYQSNADLPDDVKNALPNDAQSVFRGAFNSSFEKTKDEKIAASTAWAAVKNAGFVKSDEGGKWKKMQDNASTHEFDAEVFSVGVWNGDKYTIDDLKDMADNFSALANQIKPPVKLGHDKSKVNDGAPALGWVKSLKVAGNKLIATLTDVPDIVYQAIKRRLYKRISSEIFWNLKHGGKTFKRVLSAVALLGADIPAVKDLQDLEAFLAQKIDSDSFEHLKAYSFDTDDGDVITIKNNVDSKEVKNMSDDKIKQLSDRLDALEAENKTLKDDNEKVTKKYDDLVNTVSTKEKAAKIDALKSFCEGQVKAGKMLPAQRDVIVAESAVKTYTDQSPVISFEQFEKFADLNAVRLDLDEHGKHKQDDSDKDPTVQLHEKIQKYCADHNVGYDVAYNEVLKLNPDLAKQYVKGGE